MWHVVQCTFSNRAGVLALKPFGTRKKLVFVRLCIRYSLKRLHALKCKSNFFLPRVMSKYVTTSDRSSFIVQVQAFNFLCCRTSANCYWSHTVTHCQMCVHVALWIPRLSFNNFDCHIRFR